MASATPGSKAEAADDVAVTAAADVAVPAALLVGGLALWPGPNWTALAPP